MNRRHVNLNEPIMSAERDRQILQHNFIMINERARVKRAETQRIRDHAFQSTVYTNQTYCNYDAAP